VTLRADAHKNGRAADKLALRGTAD